MLGVSSWQKRRSRLSGWVDSVMYRVQDMVFGTMLVVPGVRAAMLWTTNSLMKLNVFLANHLREWIIKKGEEEVLGRE